MYRLSAEEVKGTSYDVVGMAVIITRREQDLMVSRLRNHGAGRIFQKRMEQRCSACGSVFVKKASADIVTAVGHR